MKDISGMKEVFCYQIKTNPDLGKKRLHLKRILQEGMRDYNNRGNTRNIRSASVSVVIQRKGFPFIGRSKRGSG